MSVSKHDLRGMMRGIHKRVRRSGVSVSQGKAAIDRIIALRRKLTDLEHPEAQGVTVVRWVTWAESEEIPGCACTTHHERAVESAIRAGGLAFSGSAHQQQSDVATVPVFSDGTCYAGSMRQWGARMAAAHDDQEEMAYARWAWSLPPGVEERYPPED